MKLSAILKSMQSGYYCLVLLLCLIVTDGTFAAEECSSETDVVKVSMGNRPHTLESNYKSCAVNIVASVNNKFPGITKIGGPAKRCVGVKNLPRKSKKQWFKETNKTCKSKKYKKYNSTPDLAAKQCSKQGPAKTRFEVFKETSGKCVLGSYKSKASDHAGGNAVDIYVHNRSSSSKPKACEEKAGDKIFAWAKDNINEKKYDIEAIIWNTKIYSKNKKGKWREKTYTGQGSKHYDHVHIQCNKDTKNKNKEPEKQANKYIAALKKEAKDKKAGKSKTKKNKSSKVAKKPAIKEKSKKSVKKNKPKKKSSTLKDPF